MKVNCSLGVLPLVYPINVGLPIYHGFAYRRETILFTWIKWGFLKPGWELLEPHTPLCSPAAFWAGMRFVLQGNSKSCWWNTVIKETKQICFPKAFPLLLISENLAMAVDPRAGVVLRILSLMVMHYPIYNFSFSAHLPQESLCSRYCYTCFTGLCVPNISPCFVLFF